MVLHLEDIPIGGTCRQARTALFRGAGRVPAAVVLKLQ
jgi:hypothetical protein